VLQQQIFDSQFIFEGLLRILTRKINWDNEAIYLRE